MSNAGDNYRSAKRRYDNAKEERSSLQRKQDGFNQEKVDFEKRLNEINEIIFMLNSRVLPPSLDSANHALRGIKDMYEKAITCSDKKNADFAEAFRMKSVDEDINSSIALSELQKEAQKLEEDIQSLNRRIANCSNSIEDCNRILRNSQSDMDYYRANM